MRNGILTLSVLLQLCNKYPIDTIIDTIYTLLYYSKLSVNCDKIKFLK